VNKYRLSFPISQFVLCILSRIFLKETPLALYKMIKWDVSGTQQHVPLMFLPVELEE